MQNLLRYLTSAVLALGSAVSTIRGITRGSDEPPQKFWAVCGLAPRDRTYDEDWVPEGSGTLVRWTDSEEAAHLGIVTVRHFISEGGGSAGDCVQSDNWYAYFYKCMEPPPWPPPAFSCISIPSRCEVDDVVRVRVTCFTMASGAFFGSDCVLVGEIDSEDIECLDQITPMSIASPYDLEVCREQPVFIAGWGRTLEDDCEEVEAHSLHVAASTISSINCEKDGRGGAILLTQGSCVVHGACVPFYSTHDSGGAIAVELLDGSLCLVGVLRGSGGEFIATRHQFFSNPSTAGYLCQPCRSKQCVDLVGMPDEFENPTPPDGREDCYDYAALQAMSAHRVNCWCVVDVDKDGCGADPQDKFAISLSCSIGGRDCDRFEWCYGDANLVGRVNQEDEDFIIARLYAECACSSCSASTSWCQGDLNCDGVVDETDLGIVSAVRALEVDGDVACQDVSIGCDSLGICP
ncbi:MAG: hypothetical protein JNK58_06315 [Phycisphaerae bacterium]|nr:hypothetical protein [Phycisphaerae bacterium]